MHFPEFHGSGLTWTEFPQTFHLGGILLNRTNSICAAKILIYELSRDELLKRELGGCRWASSAVKQMWGKPFCSNEECFQSAICFWGSSTAIHDTDQPKRDNFGVRIRTEMTRICWHNVCALLHLVWQKILQDISMNKEPLQRVYCCEQMESFSIMPGSYLTLSLS